MSPNPCNDLISRRTSLHRGAKTLAGVGASCMLINSNSGHARENTTVNTPTDENTKVDRHPHEFRRMVALGESTTAGGWSTARSRCWVSVLADLISDFQHEKIECINSGIGANVISTKSPAYEDSGKPAANERVEQHVIAHDPDLLIISYGLNDARGGTPLSLFQTEMVSLIETIRQKIQPLIILPGPYFMTDFTVGGDSWIHADLDLFKRFNAAIAHTAAAENCLYADLLAANGCTDWMVHYDGVHANDLGHRIVANRIFEVLAQNASGLARMTKQAEKNSPKMKESSQMFWRL